MALGYGIDERHLRQREPPRAAEEARPRRRRPHRRHGSEVRRMSLGRTAGLTDTGRKRRHNEDSFVLSPPVFAIADGMGGANAGEVASELAVEALREAPSDADGEGRVVSLIQEANRRVYERALEDAAASGMGTTMTLELLVEDAVLIGHVGDARAYL